MPMGSVILRPGVNTQLTQALNEAGVSVSNLVRYQDGLIQKIGGWERYYPLTIDSTIRDIHGWQSAAGVPYLAVGATESLSIIQSGSLSDITPQTRTENFVPDFSVSSGSATISIVNVGSSLTVNDTVFFNTPVAVGGTFLHNAYKVQTISGSSGYTITSTGTSSSTVVSSGILPIFNTAANSANVTVTLPNNNYQPIQGLFEGFYAATSVGGLTIQGRYQIKSVTDSTNFVIGALTEATSTATATMNSSLVQVVYYIAQGPPPGGTGYGLGGYGLGGYGLGSAGTGGSGTPITATDWSMDNWGEVLLACPAGGPIYVWSPDSGFSTAYVLDTGPFFNGGIFISMPQQILVAWKSVQSTGVQDPLIVRWSDAGDFSNWVVTTTTAAGSFHIPTGSVLRGGLQAANYGVIWTDVDVWIMQYVGGTAIFNFTRVGSGCGLVGQHAAGVIGGQVFWCGSNNFYVLSGGGVQVLPCTVWDFIFQNLDTDNASKIVCAPNSMFSEVSWFFPSADGDGENDSYVKYNLIEKQWDYGTMERNAWIDVTALGNPIGTDTTTIYQHEIGEDGDGQPIGARFESGYWSIADGNEMAFVDWFLPDMKFGTYSGTDTASVQVTFKSLDYAGATPKTYGPYTFTSSTEYLSPRIRGRMMSIIVESDDNGSFWRIGRCRYRFASAGRR